MVRRMVLSLFIIAVFLIGSLEHIAAQDGEEDIQVGVVVVGEDGQPQTFCINLSGENRTGWQALLATGLEVVADKGGMGSAVCRIDDSGCTPPDEECFCECMGGDSCAYWSYFHLSDAQIWQYSVQGASAYQVEHGDVEGWWWRNRANTSATMPVTSFDAICPPDNDFPRVVIDDLGREVLIESPPVRIASLTLASDEMLFDLVGPERLLGVTLFADDPAISNIAESLDGIPYQNLIGNPEMIISLDADLVILSTYNNPAALDQLLDADVPIFVLGEFKSLDDVRANLRVLGRVTGEEARAEALINDMDARFADIKQRVANYEPLRVLYYEPGGVTYGPGSTVNDVIRLAGGINVIAESNLGSYPLINPEYIIAADPDVILLGGWFSGETFSLEWFTQDPVFRSLRAVQTGRVYGVNDGHLTTVSHYILRGVEEVARLLYPTAFDESEELEN